MNHHRACRQLGPIAQSLSPVLYNSTLQDLARSILMTMLYLLRMFMVIYILDLKTPNVDMKMMLKEEFSQIDARSPS